MENEKRQNMFGLSQTEIDRIYYMQHRVYWEADFVNRCIERRVYDIGLCNLPYDSLAYESMILDTAYEVYWEIEDCNVSYNDTLDAVIDEIEQLIANGTIRLLSAV